MLQLREREGSRAQRQAAGRQAASSSARSSGGASRWWGCSGAGQARPSAVVATACCTATLSMPHQRRVQPARAAGRRAGRPDSEQVAQEALGFGVQRPPTSEPSTTRCCGPAEFWVSAAPSVSAVPVCGCPARVRGGTSVASQHLTTPWRRSVHNEVEPRRRSSDGTPGAVVCASHCSVANFTKTRFFFARLFAPAVKSLSSAY